MSKLRENIAFSTKHILNQFNMFLNALKRLFIQLFKNALKSIHECTQKKVCYFNKTYWNSIECISY